MKTKLLVSLSAMGLLATACATNQGMIDPSEGKAYKASFENHVVDKNAVPGAPELHPDKAAAAVERYLTDQVKQPESGGGLGLGGG